jgi:hypothetical protein
MMFDQTTFLSVMIGLSIIFSRRAALSPSVICQILHCGLLADMIMQK